jgi:hypothetical protein
MKLNLGCGEHKIDGYVNVDRHGSADVLHDLEDFPWPWLDSSVDEIFIAHTLEHLGADFDTFIGIIKEMYRICVPNALVKIVVPHPRHDHFICDPSHVRTITKDTMFLFSKRLNRQYAACGFSNSPLGLYYDVDFDVEYIEEQLDQKYDLYHRLKGRSEQDLEFAKEHLFNVISQIEIHLRVLKGV